VKAHASLQELAKFVQIIIKVVFAKKIFDGMDWDEEK
jgi:hypothetical protein